MLRIDILTLFGGMFSGPFEESIVKRARQKGLVDIGIHDLRQHAKDRHRTVDDRPFGGGPGMVIKPDIVFEAVEHLVPALARADARGAPRLAGEGSPEPRDLVPPGTHIILTDPQGRRFDQATAVELARASHLIFLCGHYEGIDERVREHLVTDAYSIGDYVLTGGELPAMVMVDAIVRLLPGAVGHHESPLEDSFYRGVLDHPHYTRPAVYRGWRVPDVLLSGNHQAVARWRREQALLRTLRLRPDLLARAPLTEDEQRWLASQAASEAGYEELVEGK